MFFIGVARDLVIAGRYGIGNYLWPTAQNQGWRPETSMTPSSQASHRRMLEPSNSLHPGLKPPSFLHQSLDRGQPPSLAIWGSRASSVPAWRRCTPSVPAWITELPPSQPGADHLQPSQPGTADLPLSQSGDTELRLTTWSSREALFPSDWSRRAPSVGA